MNQCPEKYDRKNVPELDEILGVPFPVLDDGFIRVVDYLGSDESIVQAARISYGQGTKKVHEDRGLIRYLMRNRHSTPFEMCEIKLHVRVPMDCWRQWIRHRTANVNEYSTRYSDAIDSQQTTTPDGWRSQSAVNRQGSATNLADVVGDQLSRRETELHTLSRSIYEERLQAGVAREQARKDLPLSTYTEAYWKIDLHNLLHFLSLRMDSHAQSEIRDYANVIGNAIVAEWLPITWEAFTDYRLKATSLSRLDVELLKHIYSRQSDKAIDVAKGFGWLDGSGKPSQSNRERIEFEAKLERLGIEAPWSDN